LTVNRWRIFDALQWGATLTWSAELPLPLPLQFDEVAAGCRLGFVTVRDGAVCLVSRCALNPTLRLAPQLFIRSCAQVAMLRAHCWLWKAQLPNRR
jgi:hypothetical protein